MKRFSEQLHKKSQTVKLTKSEQADLRERLVSYMEYHPLPASMKETAAPRTTKTARLAVSTESFAQYSIPFQSLFKFGSVAAVFVLLAVPFMAERSVPGDSLYAVKVQFNEELRSTLTWGSYEKVEWETERLNRRIAEARLLEEEGLLTQEAEAQVAAAVKEHSDNAKREIAVLRTSDADEATIATIAFDSSLEVQAQALEGRQAIGGGEAAVDAMSNGNLISDAIGQSLEKDPATENAAPPAYNKLMVRIELNTTRLRELRDSLVGEVSSQDLTDVTRRIQDIDRAIVDAVALKELQETDLAARTALVDVLTRTQKLIVFMTDLKVREDVTIETVVPVVLTKEEMSNNRSARTAELAEVMNQVADALKASTTDASLLEKIVDTSEKLTAVQAQLAETDDYKAFVTLSDSALALANDSLALIARQGIDTTKTEPVMATSSKESIDETQESETATTTDEIDGTESSETETEDEAGETENTDEIQDITVNQAAASTTEEIDSLES